MHGLAKVRSALPPFFAIPTATGMGSDASATALIVDAETEEKYKLTDPKLIPHEVVLDPLVTGKLLPDIIAANGMDSLTHAVEAYIGRQNTSETRELAKEAVKLVFDNLHNAYTDREDITTRLNMQRAAHFGGIVSSRTRPGNVRALSNALSTTYNIPQGAANAVILPYVLEDYDFVVYQQLSELADILGIEGDTIEQKSTNFIAAIRDLNISIGISEPIGKMKEEDISFMAALAFNEANPAYPVPKIFSSEDFASLCLRLMGKSGLSDFSGKAAFIDLSKGEISDMPLSKDDYDDFLGGKGLAAKIFYSTLNKKVEAFSEENLIVITTSPLNETFAPSASRFNISTISPLTGLLTSSNCGGNFGRSLRRTGYAALVISGTAPEKTYIRIDDDKIELLDASDMWGKNTSQSQEMMSPGDTLAIGIAGENLVRYACVASRERASGRGGVGAVFGFKQLKGIVVKSKYNSTTTSEEFKNLSQKWITKLLSHPITGDQLPKMGTSALLQKMQHAELLATKNYQKSQFDKFEDISGETLTKKHLVKNSGCISCPIRCGRIVEYEGRKIKGPEIETLVMLGSNLENNDMGSIIRLNHLCDEYGIDTISFGGSVGFAMELNEKGLWDNGLKFGDTESLDALFEQVVNREGIGDDIAEGVMRMSEKYGGREFAMHVKGMELPAYDPRSAQGMGLGYATSNRGACHLNGGFTVALEGLDLRVNGRTTHGKAALTVLSQDIMEAISASGSCLFTLYASYPAIFIKNPNNIFVRIKCAAIPYFGGLMRLLHNHSGLFRINLPRLLPHPYAIKLITGNNMDIGRFIRAGERIYNIERLVNIRQGLKDGDTLPNRLKSPLHKKSGQRVVELNRMLKKYYRIRGWDAHGVPKKRRLKKLKLDY